MSGMGREANLRQYAHQARQEDEDSRIGAAVQ